MMAGGDEPASSGEVVLALGGGVARGLAHIGVLRALESDGFRVVGVAGTSIGALIGAMIAQGARAEEIRRRFAEVDWNTVGRILVRSLTGTAFADLVYELVGSGRIGDLATPYAAVACDLRTGAPAVLRQGSIARAIIASTAVPGLMSPQIVDGRTLIDGAMASPVPVSAARSLRRGPVVAVNVLRLSPEEAGGRSALATVAAIEPPAFLQRLESWFLGEAPGRWEALLRSLHVVQHNLALRDCESVSAIEPEVGAFGWFDFPRLDALVEAGEEAYQRWRATGGAPA